MTCFGCPVSHILMNDVESNEVGVKLNGVMSCQRSLEIRLPMI